MTTPLHDEALDQIFRNARTHTVWQDRPVPDELLRQVYDLAKMAPTSANGSPARFVFIRSKEAKERLKPALMPGNVDKTMAAPGTVVIAHDLKFYEELPKLFPQANMKAHFAGNEALAQETAFRNGTLQGAYFIIAARALGLDCGPMSGFNKDKVDAEFLQGTSWKSNFLCNLGYGEPAKLHPRNPRLDFDATCRII